MTTPVLLQEFGELNPFTVDALNTMFRALAGQINGLAGQQLLSFNALGGNTDTTYMPLEGGDFTGAITAPAVLVGDVTTYPVVTTNDAAGLAVRGAVLKAAAVSVLALTISNPPTQAEVQAIHDKLNALITALKASGALA